MPRRDQQLLQVAVSYVLSELENELVDQVLGEFAGRRALLARAVSAAEAAVCEVYEKNVNGWQLDYQGKSFEVSPVPLTPHSPPATFRQLLVLPGQRTGASKAAAVDVQQIGTPRKPTVTPRMTPRGMGTPRGVTTPRTFSNGNDTSILPFLSQPSCHSLGTIPGESADAQKEKPVVRCTEASTTDALASKVRGLLTNLHGDAGIETARFIIDNTTTSSSDFEWEFNKRGISSSDMVVVKDANGVVVDDMTVGAFTASTRQRCLPQQPLLVTCSKASNGNVCTVSTPRLTHAAVRESTKPLKVEPPVAGNKQTQSSAADHGNGRSDSKFARQASPEFKFDSKFARQASPQFARRPQFARQENSLDSLDSSFKKVAKAVSASGIFGKGGTHQKSSSELSCTSDLPQALPDLMDLKSNASLSESIAKQFDVLPIWQRSRSTMTIGSQLSPKGRRVERAKSWSSEAESTENNGLNRPRRSSVTSTTSVSTVSLAGDAAFYIASSEQEGIRDYFWQRVISRPTSIQCMAWDTLKSVAVLYDLIVIPLSAFSLPNYATLMIVDAIVSCIWALDIFVSFLRGFIDEKKGVVEMNAREIALRYIGTWFFFDVFVVAIDIIPLLMKHTLKNLQGIMSLLPMLRLIRVMKLPSLLNMLSELMGLKPSTEKWSFILRIVNLLAVFLVLNHFISCGWYALGNLRQKDGVRFSGHERWVDVHFDEAADIGYRYTTSFHWSLTQFTPASMEVTPSNSMERFYNVCIIVCGFLMFSSFVSMMTQSITQLQQANLAEKKSMQQLRRFIAWNNFSVETIGKIMSFLHEDKKTVRKKKLHEEDIEALKRLPHTLRQHIRIEMYGPVLAGHPLMSQVESMDFSSFKSLCHHALSQKSLARGEILFQFGADAPGMYFITDGTLHYHLGYELCIDEVLLGDRGGRNRLCEGSLWARWVHRGRTIGEDHINEVVVMETSQFAKVCTHSPLIHQLKRYADMFMRQSLTAHGDPLHIKDTWGCDDDVQNLVDYTFMSFTTPVLVALRGRIDPCMIFGAWRTYTLAAKQSQRRRANSKGRSFSSFLTQSGFFKAS